jgi:hypothetical protein
MLTRFLILAFALFVSPAAFAQTEADKIATNFDPTPWIGTCGPAEHCDISEWDEGQSSGPPNAGNEGKLRFFCESSHLSYDDPILFPGQPGATHLHMFFGNTLTAANSTYRTLRTTGGSTCQGGPLNRTGYWAPALIRPQNNMAVKVDYILFYYKDNRRDHTPRLSGACPAPPAIMCPEGPIRPIPRGLSFITGRNPADISNSNDQVITWSCIASNGSIFPGQGSKSVLWDPVTPSNGIQGCPTNYQLIAGSVSNPCWNGELSSANGRDHLVKHVPSFVDGNYCPSTHPYLIPVIIFEVAFSHNGEDDYSQWYLSSDRFNGATHRNGESLHFDWFGAWDDDVFETFHKFALGFPGDGALCCAEAGSQIMTTFDGALGDGRQLVPNSVTTAQTAEGSRYMEIPSRQSRRRGKGRMR